MDKTRSLLVVHSGYPEATNFFIPDSGLASLAACLLDAGHETEILDFNTPANMRRMVRADRPADLARLVRDRRFDELQANALQDEEHHRRVFEDIAEEAAAKVEREGVRWVGFKLWSGDSLTASHAIARAIKARCPSVTTIAGGPQVDRLQDLILSEFPAFDFASVREGEPCIVPFAEMVSGRRGRQEVPNLLYRDGGRVAQTGEARVADLDALPLPCYTTRGQNLRQEPLGGMGKPEDRPAPGNRKACPCDVYDEAVYPSMASGKLKILCFEESRGCSNRCAFCTHRSKAGHLRVKRPERVIADLELLLARTGAPAFRLSGSYTPGRILQEIADHFLARHSTGADTAPFLWTTFGHVRDSGNVDFSKIRDAGCVAMVFGVESGSQRILDKVHHKGIKVAQIRDTLVAARRAGIEVLASLIYPNHSESEESRNDTLRLLAETRPYGISVFFPGLFPGSRGWDEPQAFGFHVEDLESYRRSLLGFKVRIFLPLELWDHLHVQLDGKPPEHVARECLDLGAAVRALGIQTAVPDEVLLFSTMLHLEPVKLRDGIVQAFLAGDVDFVEDLLRRVNSGRHSRDNVARSAT